MMLTYAHTYITFTKTRTPKKQPCFSSSMIPIHVSASTHLFMFSLSPRSSDPPSPLPHSPPPPSLPSLPPTPTSPTLLALPHSHSSLPPYLLHPVPNSVHIETEKAVKIAIKIQKVWFAVARRKNSIKKDVTINYINS